MRWVLLIAALLAGGAVGGGASERPLVTACCGKGELAACASMAALASGPEAKALLERVTRRAKREAWSGNGRLVVVPRVAEDGGRYLFLLNPDLDAPVEERVNLARPANQAVDVSVAGGYPVPLKRVGGGVSFDVRLGPGESTALWLE